MLVVRCNPNIDILKLNFLYRLPTTAPHAPSRETAFQVFNSAFIYPTAKTILIASILCYRPHNTSLHIFKAGLLIFLTHFPNVNRPTRLLINHTSISSTNTYCILTLCSLFAMFSHVLFTVYYFIIFLIIIPPHL